MQIIGAQSVIISMIRPSKTRFIFLMAWAADMPRQLMAMKKSNYFAFMNILKYGFYKILKKGIFWLSV